MGRIMKRIAILLILVCFLPIAFADPSVSKQIPNEVQENIDFTVTLVIDTDSVDKFDIAEFIPEDWEITDWDIKPELNIDFDSITMNFMKETRNMNHWKFNSVADEITIEYTVQAEGLGTYEFITLWLHPNGFDSFSDDVKVVKEVKEDSNTGVITGFAINPEPEIEEALEIVIDEYLPVEPQGIFSSLKTLAFNVPY